MKPTFHTLAVTDLVKETDDCTSIAFEVPSNLEEAYRFLPGQYLTLETEIEGELVRRSYSICSSPLDGELRVAVKKLEGGKFSTYANDHLQTGAEMAVMTPMGNFTTPIQAGQRQEYVAFAAGSGITPILSLIKTVLLTEKESTFTLFYGNRRTDSIIFREQIEGLKNQFLGRLSVHYVMSREHPGSDLFYGHIDSEKCGEFCDFLIDIKAVDHYFLCGPEEMILSVKDTLIEKGAAPETVHFELFTTGAAKKKGPAKKREKFASLIEVTIDGNTFAFPHNATDGSILDGALKSGADLPFACKGGVCCTCRAKVTEGKVEMEINYALEHDEVEAGFVLTCQSFPRTDKVAINFDL